MTMTDRKQQLASLKEGLAKETSVSWVVFAVVSVLGMLLSAITVFFDGDPIHVYLGFLVAFPMYAFAHNMKSKQKYLGPMIDVLIDMDEGPKD